MLSEEGNHHSQPLAPLVALYCDCAKQFYSENSSWFSVNKAVSSALA